MSIFSHVDARARARFGVLMLAAMACLPFVSVWPTSPIDTFYAECIAFVCGLAAVTAALTLGLPKEVPRIVVLPGLLTLLIALHAILGRAADTQLAQLAGLYLAFSVAIIVSANVLSQTIGKPQVARAVAWAIVVGASWNAIAALAQAYGFANQLGGAVIHQYAAFPYGNLGQSNHLADYCALGVLAAAYLRAEARLREWPFALIVLLLLYAVVLSASRAGWVYMGLIVLGAGGFARATDASTRARLVRVALIVIVTFVIAQIGVWLFPAESATATALTRFRSMHHGEERWRIWQGAWQMFLSHPWFGVGYGNFAARFFELAASLPPPRPSEVAHNGHNLFLHVLAEFGLAGLIVLLGSAYLWLRAATREKPSLDGAWLIGVVIIVGVHAMLEYPLWYAHFLGLFAVAIGMTDAARLQWRPPRSATVLTWAALIIGWFVLASTVNDYHFLARLQGPERAQVLALGKEHITERLLRIDRTSFLRHYAALGFDRAIELSSEHLEDKLTVSATAMRVTPTHDVAYRHALLLALANDSEAAKITWDRAVASYPAHTKTWIAVARANGSPQLAAMAQYAENTSLTRH